MDPYNIEGSSYKSRALFLDRDGVLNVESVGSYITSWEDFEFHEGVLSAINTLTHIFDTIVVVTNQRGVGRGIMSMGALKDISTNMVARIKEHGGRIDKVYACTAVANEDHNRKPNTGMGLQAKEDFPQIDFKNSVMVGNTLGDMEFGKRLGMHTVFLTTKHPAFDLPNDLIDEQYPSLEAWARKLALAAMVG
jgi:D-glycero-D-manno-heptose 1,7-bisphosphate phosphatase